MIEKYHTISKDSASVQTHLKILQDVITRLALNSALLKTLCIVTTTTLFAVIAINGNIEPLIILIPIFLFCALDIYYLALERKFRKTYSAFVKKLHNGTLVHEDLYAIKPENGGIFLDFKGLLSFSVWGFYLIPIVLPVALIAYK